MVSKKVAIVIIAQNEQERIEKTLRSILDQTFPIHRIICIDDGSTDKTLEIIQSFNQVEIFRSEIQHSSYVGRKELASIINLGLNKLKIDDSIEYIAILGADTILPKNYFQILIERMEKDENIAIASGVIKGEYSRVPRGSGRVVRTKFWKKLGLQYPINYGFEAYLVLKAESMGFITKTYQDLIFETQRKTGTTYSNGLYKYHGMAMKALGYTFQYALGRSVLLMKKSPIASLYLISGFFSKEIQFYDTELREFVKQKQKSLPLEYYLNRAREK